MSSSVSSVANCVEHISFGKGNQLCDLIDLQFITYIIVKYYHSSTSTIYSILVADLTLLPRE